MRNVSGEAAAVFPEVFSPRGLAIGDYNNDGRPDLLVGGSTEARQFYSEISRDIRTEIFEPLGGSKASRFEMQSRRDWRAAELIGCRGEEVASEDRRRQARKRDRPGLARYRVARTGHAGGPIHKAGDGEYTTLIEGSGN